jgi:hypothetical protein
MAKTNQQRQLAFRQRKKEKNLMISHSIKRIDTALEILEHTVKVTPQNTAALRTIVSSLIQNASQLNRCI